MAGGKVEIYPDARGKFRFRVRASNGMVLAQSETFETAVDAERASYALRRTVADPRTDALASGRQQQDPELDKDQLRLIHLAFEAFHRTGDWTTFGRVRRPLRREGFDPEKLVRSVPRALLLSPRAGLPPQPDDRLVLTIRGIAKCPGGGAVVSEFLRLLAWLVQKDLDFDQVATGAPAEAASFTSADVADVLGVPVGDVVLKRIYAVLMAEQWGRGDVSGGGSDVWTMTITDEIHRFGDAKKLGQYLDAQAVRQAQIAYEQGWMQYQHATLVGAGDGGPGEESQVEPAAPYVDPSVIRALEDAAPRTSLDCTKLLRLVQELNEAWASGQIYGSLALIRAIIHHVPPIFNTTSFDVVVNNHGWTRTDKAA